MKKVILVGFLFALQLQTVCIASDNNFEELRMLCRIGKKKSEREEQKRQQNFDELISLMRQFDKNSSKNYWLKRLKSREEEKERLREALLDQIVALENLRTEYLKEGSILTENPCDDHPKDQCLCGDQPEEQDLLEDDYLEYFDPTTTLGGSVSSIYEVGGLDAAFRVVGDDNR